MKVKQISFEYSNRPIYYCVWFGLALAITGIITMVSVVNTEYINRFILTISAFQFMLSIIIAVVLITCFCFIGPFFVATLFVCRQGLASFYSDYVLINMHSKTLKLSYNQIDKVKLKKTYSVRTMGPPLYRLKIYHDKKCTVLVGSFKEAWKNRNTPHKIGVNRVYEQLNKYKAR